MSYVTTRLSSNRSYYGILLLGLALIVANTKMLASEKEDAEPDTALEVQGSSSVFAIDIFGLGKVNSGVVNVIRGAFGHLADIWKSSVPVLCRVSFTDLDVPESLASGGGALFVRFDGSPDQELMPIAAAEAITGRNLNEFAEGLEKYDVLVKINSRTPWHIDLDTGPAESDFDLFTIVIHEAYHNLLFSGAIAVNAGYKREAVETGAGVPLPTARLLDGYPARFDLFLSNEQGCSILDYQRDASLANSTGRTEAQLLAQAVTNDRLFFHDRTSGVNIPLYAPLRYQSKSSIYHIDTRRGGTAGIMNRFIPRGFMQRRINAEILHIQTTFLNPVNRGAKRCKFPLTDPAPSRGPISSLDLQVSEATILGVPIWVLVVACVVFTVLSTAGFFYYSGYNFKRSGRFRARDVAQDARREGSCNSSSSHSWSGFVIDRGLSCETLKVAILNLENDEDVFQAIQYTPIEGITDSTLDYSNQSGEDLNIFLSSSWSKHKSKLYR